MEGFANYIAIYLFIIEMVLSLYYSTADLRKFIMYRYSMNVNDENRLLLQLLNIHVYVPLSVEILTNSQLHYTCLTHPETQRY